MAPIIFHRILGEEQPYPRVRPRPLAAAEFATELPPNSPEKRKNPASATRSRRAVLGFLKRRGGDSNPQYRLRRRPESYRGRSFLLNSLIPKT